MAFSRLTVLFEKYGGSDYIGEPVSILQHSLQAAYFAQLHFEKHSIPLDSCAHEVIIAALLHDIGHVMAMEVELSNNQQQSKYHTIFESMDHCGVVGHEHIAADFLQELSFSSRLASLVRCHVPAKRYLCGRKPEYYNELSEASKTTLRFQGGPMSEEECLGFEKDPELCNHALLVRSFDEMAKVKDLIGKVPHLPYYRGMIESLAPKCKNYQLSSLQVNAYLEYGFLKVRNLLQYSDLLHSDLVSYCDEISQWDCGEGMQNGKWLQHYELVKTKPNPSTGDKEEERKVLCRTENFVNYHGPMSSFVHESLCGVVSQLFKEDGILFKEKINFKHPGGGGFACHQDTPAYIGMGSRHISVMVAIDRATEENGCLEVALPVSSPSLEASVRTDTNTEIDADTDTNTNTDSSRCARWGPDQLPLDPATGVVTSAAEADLEFLPMECEAGDVLFFNGYLPHRSKMNNSSCSRRAFFLTFNAKSEGDFHDEYYRKKHQGHEDFDRGTSISFQQDFQGKVVE